jgi:hypothetical protein
METKQTAVQLLQDKLLELKIEIDSKTHEEVFFLFEQAKQMEKEQIEKAFQHSIVAMIVGKILSPEEYYNETYKKK